MTKNFINKTTDIREKDVEVTCKESGELKQSVQRF